MNNQCKNNNLNVGDYIIFEDEESLHCKNKPIVGILTESGCVENISHAGDGHGYFHCERKGKAWKVHRYIFYKYCTELGEGEIVRHLCNNSKCINPDHLEKGTHKDNAMDRILAGNQPVGSQIHTAKLNEDQVILIFISNKSAKELSEEYGVSVSTIYSIKKGKTWRHVTINIVVDTLVS